MGIRVSLHHVTHYKYDRPVQFGPHVVRLRPAPHSRTRELVIRMPREDSEEPQTLNLRDLSALGAVSVQQPRGVTSQLPIVESRLSANQRCPRCGDAVSSDDEECANCKYRWGAFRPQAVTDVRENPLSRRRHERRPVELSIVYVSSELEIEATSRDLSQSGVFVCSEVLDPIGTECELTILLDGGPPLHIKGVVRRVVERQEHPDAEPCGLGIEFSNVGATERAWLEATVERMVEAELAASLGAGTD